MPEVIGIEKLFSIRPAKRFGKPCRYGKSMLGFSNYGAEEILFNPTLYGKADFGKSFFGARLCLSGIYKKHGTSLTKQFHRIDYYITKNPRSIPQQANRQKYADGVLAWQNLTEPEKIAYNKSAIGKRMSGYNLFLKQYLLSH